MTEKLLTGTLSLNTTKFTWVVGIDRCIHREIKKNICFRNRSALAVNCWVIIQCLEVSCKGDQNHESASDLSAYSWLTNSELLLNNLSTAIELIYFESNTQETKKKQLYPSDSCSFPPLHWRNPAKDLTEMQASTCISYVSCAKTTLHC